MPRKGTHGWEMAGKCKQCQKTRMVYMRGDYQGLCEKCTGREYAKRVEQDMQELWRTIGKLPPVI